MRKQMAFLFFVPFVMLACSSQPKKTQETSAEPAAVTSKEAAAPAEDICQNPDKKTQCLEILKILATEKNLAKFKREFVQFCTVQTVTCRMIDSTPDKAKTEIASTSPRDRIYYIPRGKDKVSIFAALAN